MLSLIICTRNRATTISRCLQAVAALRCRTPWEFVIVDNGSTDATHQVVTEWASRCGFAVRIVFEPRQGLGRARNAGLRTTRGDIFAFTDDDCYPQPDYLEQVVAVFADPLIAYMGGRILLYDAADAPVTIRTETQRQDIPAGSFVPPGLVHGANMAVRRELVTAIGGFDPMLGAGTLFPCEDAEYVARASLAGWRGSYEPGPVVYHHHGRKAGPEADAHARRYDYARGAYYARFLLRPGARRLYARAWARSAVRDLRHGTPLRPLREAMGALRYALQCCRAREAIPAIR